MNREMRRLSEREQRLQKQKDNSVTARAATVARRKAAKAERGPWWKRLILFIEEVKVELKKVSCPTLEQLKAFTAVTLITSVALTLLIFALDFGFVTGVVKLLGGING
jgi:preprotein translocase SecE subunit